MSKILILMGRGIEGTGQTRITIEIFEWLKKQGHEVDCVANSEKKWGRAKAQDHNIRLIDFSKDTFYVKEYNKVIISSVPAKNFSKKSKQVFHSIVQDINVHITYLQVDHKIQSINRNYYMEEEYEEEFFQAIDLIVTHSLKNSFCTKVLDRHLNLFNNIKVRELMMISADFDELAKYQVPWQEKLDKTCYFIGRSARWKGWPELRELHCEHLKVEGYTTIAEGIEKSIGSLQYIYKTIKPKVIRDDNIMMKHSDDSNDYFAKRNTEMMLFGPYKRDEALTKIGKAKFGMFFTFIGEEAGGPLENTLLEIIGCGTVPVVRKELFDIAFPNEVPYLIGMIVYDSEKPEDTVAMLNELNDDQLAYDTYRMNAAHWARSNYDRDVIIKKFYQTIEEEI